MLFHTGGIPEYNIKEVYKNENKHSKKRKSATAVAQYCICTEEGEGCSP